MSYESEYRFRVMQFSTNNWNVLGGFVLVCFILKLKN